MAEPAKPRRASVRAPDEDDALAAINDHLGRFLQNADQLLDEWSRFGGEVRVRVSNEVERVGGAVEEAVDGAVDRIAARAGERVADEVAGRLVIRLADVGAELERVARAARRASAAAAEIQGERHRTSRWIAGALGAALLADVLLVVLLLRDTPAPATVAVEPELVEPAPRAAGVDTACEELARAWSDPAFAIVRAVGVSACGDLAATVDAVIVAHLAPPGSGTGTGTGSGTGSGTGTGTGTGSGTGTGTGTGSAKAPPRITPAPARHRKGR